MPTALRLNPTRKQRVCLFDAYAKNVIENIKKTNIPVSPGLSDNEFIAIESFFNIKFPSDLQSFLREGLPTGPGFPNWRSSSVQQLQILTHLPLLGLLQEVSKDRFWGPTWPEKPDNTDNALKLAKKLLQMVPVLLPVYKYCYIPCTPNLAGNPIIYVKGGDVRILSFDLTGFFNQVDFRVVDSVINQRSSLGNLFKLPSWAADEARAVTFWSDVAVYGGRSRADQGWWSRELVRCMERLRDGGWGEEEVREMMMVMDGGDHTEEMSVLSVRLLSAGWSLEDVVESLGCDTEPSFWLEFQHGAYNYVLEVV